MPVCGYVGQRRGLRTRILATYTPTHLCILFLSTRPCLSLLLLVCAQFATNTAKSHANTIKATAGHQCIYVSAKLEEPHALGKVFGD